jgi:predicted nucleotidyltransferase
MKFTEPFGKMITGITISEMRKEILSTVTRQSGLHSVFGFGSYFRGDSHNDIDVLVVLKGSPETILAAYYSAKGKLEALGRRLDMIFDVTALTLEEFLERPLLEMDHLVPIYPCDDVSACAPRQ